MKEKDNQKKEAMPVLAQDWNSVSSLQDIGVKSAKAAQETKVTTTQPEKP